ncbi:hypothetical protein PVK06_028424 [Gossypium arboreum]|uniref:Uncharacterized protein n=1 Tax=Gossypium arboreum TaxID=29729 RepID=A0ABR0P318_GOSAR|nr:hypothetical protein PVK06_028424 [Gossypium arboreum]
MKEIENGRISHHSSMPLVSRLDHLDFIMKYLEGKISLQKGMEKARLPLDLAMREAYFKGSLLDRVTSLEHRVFQLCLDLEFSSTSSTSTSTSGYASSSRGGSRGQSIPRSLPTFTNPNQFHKQESRQPLLSRSEIQDLGRERNQMVRVETQNQRKVEVEALDQKPRAEQWVRKQNWESLEEIEHLEKAMDMAI